MLEKRIDRERLLQLKKAAIEVGYRESSDAPTQASANLLLVVWRRRWILLACVAVSLAAAVVYVHRATPLYHCGAQVYVPDSGPRIISNVVSSATTSGNFLSTQCELIKSTPVIEAALQLPDVKRATWLHPLGPDPVSVLRGALDVQVAKQGDIISVSMEMPYPRDAAFLINEIVRAYIDFQNNQHRSTSAEFLRILQKEKNRRDAELQSTYNAMLAFKKEHGLLSLSGHEDTAAAQRLETLSAALTAAQLQELELKLTLESTLSKDFRQTPDELSGTSSGTTIPLSPADNDFHELRRRAAELEVLYGPNHPLVREVNGQIAELHAELSAPPNTTDKSSTENYRAALRVQLERIQKKQAELSREVEAQRKLALDVNARIDEYNLLQANATRTEKVLDLIDSRIKELNVTEDAGAQNISILEPARPENVPVRPNKAQAMGLSLVMGLMLGFGSALLQDWLDQRLRSSEEIERVLKLPVLGVVPHMIGKRTPAERGQEVQLIPRSDVSESYRTVRTTIHFGLPEGRCRTLLVTSPSQGDGKTTTASNLATAIAQTGRRVLLIDADCRKPMQHRVHNVAQGLGLSSILRDDATVEQCVQTSATKWLDILPCGPLPPNPSEMLNSHGFAELLARLSARYDQVVIDSPPVVPVTDARILGAICDITILVLRADRSTRRLAEHARDSLVSVGANILGLIVNDVPRGQDGYAFYKGKALYQYAPDESKIAGETSNADEAEAASAGHNGHDIAAAGEI